jgi:hypothetical protein
LYTQQRRKIQIDDFIKWIVNIIFIWALFKADADDHNPKKNLPSPTDDGPKIYVYNEKR